MIYMASKIPNFCHEFWSTTIFVVKVNKLDIILTAIIEQYKFLRNNIYEQTFFRSVSKIEESSASGK